MVSKGVGQPSLEEHERFALSREARQRDANRIRRFEERQLRERKWIKFDEIAEWYLELGGSGPNEAAREHAYDILKRDLLSGVFEESGRSQVLFLLPGVTLNRRMPRQRLQDAIDHNYDNQRGRSWLENCWLPRKVFKRWCARHHLPESPPRFEPTEGKHVTQSSGKSGPPAPATRQPQQERARRALTALFGSEVPDAAVLPNKHLATRVNKWLEERQQPPVRQRTIQRAAGRK
jgi:hypothetical protein